ncbi:hypothetical protein M404DRAFT_1003962 [Pisolithus tinctorius Marx 270]|uniref:Uncharacterized protein n=1 Tax=Pisolithus tinctorius Marx 270 TaxID=870435 RepID=A0A0C3JS12_PISTI|nr:hypothetical protein M404DRAFT_1003962 [Pisolithus tinctorius Marx 270]
MKPEYEEGCIKDTRCCLKSLIFRVEVLGGLPYTTPSTSVWAGPSSIHEMDRRCAQDSVCMHSWMQGFVWVCPACYRGWRKWT